MRKVLLGGLGVGLSLGVLAIACGGGDGATISTPDAGDDGNVSTDGAAGGAVDARGSDASDASIVDSGAPADAGSLDAGDASLLEAGASCGADSDCQSGGCDDTGHCALGRSCTQLNGGRTCGPSGTESCCTALPVPMPGAPFTLDKYSITAGRFRAFITKTNGDVRGYVQANRPAWFDPSWDAWLPNKMDDGTAVTGTVHEFQPGQGQDGVYQQLGPIHYGTEGPGNEGCLTKEVGNARTYRLPDDVNTTLFADVQQYTQDVLDQKPQQCATFFMFAAFCIWDGGRLPTGAELEYAWDEGDVPNHTYPWGNTPAPSGWDYPFDTAADALAYGKNTPAAGDQTYANYKYNFWLPTTLSCIDNDAGTCDYSIYLAPPGRFPKGNGPFGHSDLAGDVYNVAMPPKAQPGVDPSMLVAGLERTGAFDNHAIPSTRTGGTFPTYTATNKYLAVGGRCAR